jgi:glycosyltransferase involved in cell wall biosynthesis
LSFEPSALSLIYALNEFTMKISVIIPALNEEHAIAEVIDAVPAARVHEIIVVDNGSTDKTGEKAAAAGARVILESRRGYGAACLAGAKAATAEVIVFLDGDRSDDPGQLEAVAGPVIADRADLVIGSRIKGVLEKGAMPLHGRLGNRFMVFLLRRLYGTCITDIGSFRAIKAQTLFDLSMEQMTYGWPVEMVVKAARRGLRLQSVPIRYRRRIGRSKVTGTLTGTLLATYYMFLVPLKYLWKQ